MTSLNVVSRTDNKPLVHTTVDHVAFSPSGDWMATVSTILVSETLYQFRIEVLLYSYKIFLCLVGGEQR